MSHTCTKIRPEETMDIGRIGGPKPIEGIGALSKTTRTTGTAGIAKTDSFQGSDRARALGRASNIISGEGYTVKSALLERIGDAMYDFGKFTGASKDAIESIADNIARTYLRARESDYSAMDDRYRFSESDTRLNAGARRELVDAIKSGYDYDERLAASANTLLRGYNG